MFTRLLQKFIVSEASEVARWWSSTSNMYYCTWITDCQFPSPCSVISYGPRIWFPCSHSIFFRFCVLVSDLFWEAHVAPSTFLALQVQSVISVSAFVWSVQFVTFLFLFFLLSVPPCPGWSQRHFRVTVSRQKALKNSHSIWMHSVTRTIFPLFAFKFMHRVILFTRFCRHTVWGGGTCLKCLNGTTPLQVLHRI